MAFGSTGAMDLLVRVLGDASNLTGTLDKAGAKVGGIR